MSERYVKVEDVETVESSNSTALIMLLITVLAIVVIAIGFWQPWATQPPQSNSTTIIRNTKETQAPADSRPIIVNPPANSAAPPNTNITIHNDRASNSDSDKSGNTNSDSSANNDGK